MSNPATTLPPGFRFHPTDEELIHHYLRNRAAALPCPVSIIAEVDIYKFDPWDLPAKAMFGDREWYFFSPRDRKYPNGIRPNRAAGSGYWKATGTDKPVMSSSRNENIGVKKALVFYEGRPPKGLKTNWIMHEYRLAEAHNRNSMKPMKLRDSSMRLDDWVLCRIYKKSNHNPSVPPLVDPEQEDSGMEENYLSSLPSITQQNTLNIQNSSSLSELFEDPDYSVLSRLLFDNPPEMMGWEDGSLVGHSSLNQPFINSSNDYLLQQLPHETEYSVSVAQNHLKRQRRVDGFSAEEGCGLSNQSKKPNNSCTFTNFTNQFESPQYNLLNQPLLNQPILLNSHLALQ